ncbi:MAG: sugar phosphate isomerase/epimerase [Syntrophobacteraceae bacterium]|nr:sugar phosphate isomerase/epimerase [Syntrophobacteraceae bacterium]
MKLAFSSNAFVRYTLFDTIRLLAEAGYRGIEIMADVPHAYPPNLGPKDVADILAALDHYRMEISNVSSFMLRAIGDIYHPSWIEKDPALRKKRIDHTINSIELAHALGAQTVSTGPGGPLDGIERDLGIRLFLEGLREVEPIARDRKIKLIIEPEPGLMIESGVQFKEFCKELDPEVFGLNFDIGHFFCVGEDPAALIVELKDYICHFHLEDIAATRVHNHLLLGEGALDFDGIFHAMEQIGYDGFVTVELYPYEDRPVEAAGHSFDFLKNAPFGKRNFFAKG